jgi:hypothetical protein
MGVSRTRERTTADSHTLFFYVPHAISGEIEFARQTCNTQVTVWSTGKHVTEKVMLGAVQIDWESVIRHYLAGLHHQEHIASQHLESKPSPLRALSSQRPRESEFCGDSPEGTMCDMIVTYFRDHLVLKRDWRSTL